MLQGFIDRLISYKSTALAVITGLLTVLVAVGVVKAEALTDGVAATGQLFEAIIALLGVIVTLGQLFRKNPDDVAKVKKAFGVK
jgi:hypothetical protein